MAAQSVIAVIKPLCDVCVQLGVFDVSMELIYLEAWEGPSWTCKAHHRFYHLSLGYQSREGNSLVDRCSEGCGVNMYIQKVDPPNLVIFACPKCGYAATPVSWTCGGDRPFRSW